jgi:hypothetical protein
VRGFFGDYTGGFDGREPTSLLRRSTIRRSPAKYGILLGRSSTWAATPLARRPLRRPLHARRSSFLSHFERRHRPCRWYFEDADRDAPPDRIAVDALISGRRTGAHLSRQAISGLHWLNESSGRDATPS